jgi:hypothetical protein
MICCEKNMVSWLVIDADLVREKSIAGWWNIERFGAFLSSGRCILPPFLFIKRVSI